MTHSRLPLALFAALLATFPAAAQADELIGTRATGMAGSARAAAGGLSAVFLNPAGLSLGKTYVVGATYQYRFSDNAHMLNAAVVDSVTSRVAAGLYYSYVNAKPQRSIADKNGPYKLEETRQAHVIGLSTAMALGRFAILGLTNKYINVSSSLPEDTPERISDNVDLKDISMYGLDVGLIVPLVKGLRIAAVGHNLVPVDKELFPLELAFGASYSYSTFFTLAFDGVIDFQSDPDGISGSVHGGGEVFLGKRVVVRAGGRHHLGLKTSHVTGGLGLVLSKLSLEASLQQQVDGGSETSLAFALSMFVQ